MSKSAIFLGLLYVLSLPLLAQQKVPLTDLSAFKNPSPNWRIVGDAAASLTTTNSLQTTPGTGVLACIHEQGVYGEHLDLYTKESYGDMDLSFDFMMAKGSNSGVYLQGRYEVQLLDSWGKTTAKYNDVGGIYERWNDAMPEGQKGYEGYAPRVNAAKAPGLWQNMKISFQAPRFDSNGQKTADAKILRIELNGQLLHENVELTGVTRGAMAATEAALGPLRFQGDHGSVAFKNITITNYNLPAASLKNLQYKVYYGGHTEFEDRTKLKIDGSGTSEQLTWEVSKEPNDYMIVYAATLVAPTAGLYTFSSQLGGSGEVSVNGKKVIPMGWTVSSVQRTGSIELPQGEHQVHLLVNKRDNWLKPALGLWVAGPGFRATPMHSLGSTLANKPSDPIIVKAETPTHLRSFMDVTHPQTQKSSRVVHAISVGHPAKLHYTYDLDRGTLVQVWRGDFLDATPMWEDRGDGSSRPLGTVLITGTDFTLLPTTSSTDNTPTLRPKGYTLDEENLLVFQYETLGMSVTDKIRVKDGSHFERHLQTASTTPFWAKAAEGTQIDEVAKGLFAINNKQYYIQLAEGQTAQVREQNGLKQLLLPSSGGSVRYQLLF